MLAQHRCPLEGCSGLLAVVLVRLLPARRDARRARRHRNDMKLAIELPPAQAKKRRAEAP
jgi:hypothetical protein